MISISHRIELKANNAFKTYCRKAFGVSRFAWNWALAEVKKAYDKNQKVNVLALKKQFNAIKKTEFPWVFEVTKYASQQPFLHLQRAVNDYYKDKDSNKSASKRKGFPNFKKKSYSSGSFYIGGDQVVLKTGQSNIRSKEVRESLPQSKKTYLKIPNFGWVQLREELRFKGKINNVTISQEGDKFYAAFSMEIDENYWAGTHREAAQNDTVCGIDWGVKTLATLSCGVKITGSQAGRKAKRQLKRAQRRLSKRAHPKAKGDTTEKSANFIKQAKKVNKCYRKVRCQRHDEFHKITSVLIRHFKLIGLENLNAKGMLKNHKLAFYIADNSPYKFKQFLQYKAQNYDRLIVEADRFYPSSKTCNHCGAINKDLKLEDRTYVCPHCGFVIDRDLNAALNLEALAKNSVGTVGTEHFNLKPTDLTALLSDFARNGIATSRVEVGI